MPAVTFVPELESSEHAVRAAKMQRAAADLMDNFINTPFLSNVTLFDPMDFVNGTE
jgi:hypothetical protein